MPNGDSAPRKQKSLAWRRATPDDLDAIMAIQADVHTLMQERVDVFAAKLRLFPAGCRILTEGTRTLGYAVAHPWHLNDAPALDAVLTALPEPADCLFIHDVALRPEGRRRGAARDLVAEMTQAAEALGLTTLALVSVYGTYPIWEACGFRIATDAGIAPKLAAYGETARYMVARLASTGSTDFTSTAPARTP